MLIPRQGLAEAPPRSELPAWGRPSLNLQGNLHLGRGRERTHPVTVRTSSSDGGGVICRGTKLGWGQGKGYLLSGSSPAWNLQGEKEQSLHQGASGSCLALPHPTAGTWPLHCPQGGSWSFLRPHSGEQWMGFRPGAQGLASRTAREQGSHLSPSHQAPQHSGPHPRTPTHPQEWFGTSAHPSWSRRGSGRVRSWSVAAATRGRRGQSPPEQHVKLRRILHTGGSHGDRERVVGPEDPF